MSKRRGDRHLRHRRPGRAHEIGAAVVYACCADESGIEYAKRQSHDKLIQLTGGHRRGGVRWSIFGASSAREVFDDLGTDLDRYRDYLTFLDENPEGYLVVAIARAVKMAPVSPARRDEPPAGGRTGGS